MLSHNTAQAIRVTSTSWNVLLVADKIIQRCFQETTPGYIGWKCMCLPVFAHLYWRRCVCLCEGHKRKENTVHASPVLTPASASSHSSHLAGEKLTLNRMLALLRWILPKQKSTTLTLCHPELTVSQLVKCGLQKRKFFSRCLLLSQPPLYIRHQRGFYKTGHWISGMKTWLNQQHPSKYVQCLRRTKESCMITDFWEKTTMNWQYNTTSI